MPLQSSRFVGQIGRKNKATDKIKLLITCTLMRSQHVSFWMFVTFE